jgi:hypothetical protein
MALHVSRRTCAGNVHQVNIVCFDCGVCTCALLGTLPVQELLLAIAIVKLESIAIEFDSM